MYILSNCCFWSDYREWDESKVSVIKEIYDSENALEIFGDELERALEAGSSLIVVEPSRLGDETARWIAVGNCLHKTAVITGLGAIIAGILFILDWPFRLLKFNTVTFNSLLGLFRSKIWPHKYLYCNFD